MIFTRKILGIILIGLILASFADLLASSLKPAHLYADSLKKRSTTLSLPWEYHSGDNIEWAEKDFDSSAWDTLKTIILTDESDFDSWNGVGWFRRTIVVDSALMNRPVAFLMRHYGASEIYLNGKLIHKFGKAADNLNNEEIYQPRNIPISVQFDNDSVNVIAVRYSNFHAANDKEWFSKWFPYAGFQLRIADLNGSIIDAVHNEGMTLSINIGISAIFLALAFLYFILFFFYSMKKENLYYSLFTLFIALTFLLQMLNRFNHTSLAFYIFTNSLNSVLVLFIFPSYLAFLYSIFYEKFPKQFWFFTIGAVVLSVTSYYLAQDFESVFRYLILAYIFISTIEGLRVIYISIRKKKSNAAIIGIGVTIFAVFIITMFILGVTGNANINSLWGIVLFFLGLISLPASMSVFLARDIAVTNKRLKEQLETVKELSEKQIRQERKNAELKLQAELAEAENKRKTKELEEARQLQLSMLPNELPKIPNLDVAVYMQTATEVGGDYYDFHVGLDGTLTVVIGDATGHGLNAGTIVTATKSLFNSYAQNPDILFTLAEISRSIKQMKFKRLSMCLSLLKIDGNKLRISAAGMPPALIYRAADKKFEEILIKGMPLGATDHFPYQLRETELFSGDAMLLMSDGFPELFNEKKEMYGYDRAKETFFEAAESSAETIIETLKRKATEWANGKPPDDDITFIVLKMK
ncbi:MAG: SpoIIE family protein phosphatase [Chlorobi bacterium]|nr:SpoIIE family protein phosphatase [Chlorobiota bacterium]